MADTKLMQNVFIISFIYTRTPEKDKYHESLQLRNINSIW